MYTPHCRHSRPFLQTDQHRCPGEPTPDVRQPHTLAQLCTRLPPRGASSSSLSPRLVLSPSPPPRRRRLSSSFVAPRLVVSPSTPPRRPRLSPSSRLLLLVVALASPRRRGGHKPPLSPTHAGATVGGDVTLTFDTHTLKWLHTAPTPTTGGCPTVAGCLTSRPGLFGRTAPATPTVVSSSACRPSPAVVTLTTRCSLPHHTLFSPPPHAVVPTTSRCCPHHHTLLSPLPHVVLPTTSRCSPRGSCQRVVRWSAVVYLVMASCPQGSVLSRCRQ